VSLLAALLVWYGAGCWEDGHGNFVLVNTTVKENCQPVQSWKASSAVQGVTVIRRYMAGLPLDPDQPVSKVRRPADLVAFDVR